MCISRLWWTNTHLQLNLHRLNSRNALSSLGKESQFLRYNLRQVVHLLVGSFLDRIGHRFVFRCFRIARFLLGTELLFRLSTDALLRLFVLLFALLWASFRTRLIMHFRIGIVDTARSSSIAREITVVVLLSRVVVVNVVLFDLVRWNWNFRNY